jgi:hypothetical protein
MSHVEQNKVARLQHAVSGDFRVYESLEHHDYEVLDQYCLCGVCVDWRKTQTDYRYSLLGTEQHASNVCGCSKCVRRRKAWVAYLAAGNRRDAYCEMSWHAARYEDEPLSARNNNRVPGVGQRLMAWMGSQLKDRSAYSEVWWWHDSHERTIGEWLSSFNLSLSGVGGIPI